MVIFENDRDSLARAVELVTASPNPDHLDEYRAVTGKEPSIRDMLLDSMGSSWLVGSAVAEDDAMIAGVGRAGACSPFQHIAWILATAGTRERPRWLLREGRRLLAGFDRLMGWPNEYIQAIPSDYAGGLNYVQHLGFSERRLIPSPNPFGGVLSLMAREVPR